MKENSLIIRPFQEDDEEALVYLWNLCRLTVPWNNPHKDITRKLRVQRDLFLVGYLENSLVSSVMAGYEGHRGWINYLAVHPDFQGRGYATHLIEVVEKKLRNLGCPKINLQIRKENDSVHLFKNNLDLLRKISLA